MMQVHLDRKNDILYLCIYDCSNSYGDESDEGVIVLRDMDTDQITGITIMDFLQHYRKRDLNKLSLPVNIDFSRDVFPSLHLY